MILPFTVHSLQSYIENPGVALDTARQCPSCKTRPLSRHGAYSRRVYTSEKPERITIYRLRCRPCGLTVSLLPDILRPYGRYTLELIESALDAVLEGASCRAAAVTISSAQLPPDASVTDALIWLGTKPNYQRIHAWFNRFTSTAAADLTTAAEWLVHRRPAGLGVHLVTTPLDPAPCRTTRHETRATIMAARLLARLFREDPDLNPLGHGWLRAWHRFEAVILARPPWRRPPRPPTEPQSS